MTVKHIPDGYHVVTPYLIVDNAVRLIEFYKQAFAAEEVMRLASPEGKVGHAELKIGDSTIMLAEEFPEMGARAPKSIGGTPVSMLLYVEDVDATFARALAAGGTELRPIANQFYGDRSGVVVDPAGHQWSIATHQEDVSPEEIQRRFAAFNG